MDYTSCPICGSGSLTPIRVQPRGVTPYEVLVCARCGHGLRAESRSFDANIAIQEHVFDERAQAPARPARWPRRPALLHQQIRRLVGRSGRLLDIGCGPGDWLSLFDDRWQKLGIEVSPKAAEMARNYTGAQVFCAPFEQVTNAPRGLDLITAFALIEHLSNPKRLVEWSHEHLKPSGLLVLMTGDRESAVARRLGPRWPMYEPLEHVHFFSARSLRWLVESAGFGVVHMEWRPMLYAGLQERSWPGAARLERYTAKAREVSGLIGDGRYDHLYLYARRIR